MSCDGPVICKLKQLSEKFKHFGLVITLKLQRGSTVLSNYFNILSILGMG